MASTTGGEARCARCRSVLAGGATDSTGASASKDLWHLDSWDFEEDLDAADQLVRQLRGSTDQPPSEPGPFIRIDPPHVTIQPQPKVKESAKSSIGVFTWGLFTVGLTGTVCGAMLLGWSFVGRRPDLLPVGVPFTVGGQAVLILGLLVQLEGLWRSTRDMNNSLHALDSQIDELRTQLPADKTNPSQSFYSHLAQGASPKVLLADLKSQLDLLAGRIGDS